MKKIFFIGNSFTYFNNLPGIFSEISKAAGYEVKVEMVVKGGWSFEKHLSTAETIDAINGLLNSDKWDFVVLQEQSSRPAPDESMFASSAGELCSLIRKKGAIPLFYQTWPYRYGSDKLNSTGLSYVQFYQKLRDAYRRTAVKNNTDCVPVGDVFYRLHFDRPDIDLLASDDFHPSIFGTYAAAVMFYRYVFGKDAPVLYYPEDISEDVSRVLIDAVSKSL